MGRSGKAQQLSSKARIQKDYLDLSEKNLLTSGDLSDVTRILVQNPGKEPQKTTLGAVLGPLEDKIDNLGTNFLLMGG